LLPHPAFRREKDFSSLWRAVWESLILRTQLRGKKFWRMTVDPATLRASSV
jgi:hypothetical protein